MQQSFEKYLMFRNRLQKVFRHLSKLAAKQNISCYRLYDHDLPEFPFIIELYNNKLYVAEYRRRHGLTDEEHASWLNECKKIMAEAVNILPGNIFLKLRKRKPGRLGQYQKINEEKNEFVVEEGGLKFIVNLSDYLDTGLFLDHRLTRQMIRKLAEGKKVLNLFCYTGSFSVYAAAGNASKLVSVDLSKTYLNWAERNMQLNFPEYKNHLIVHADVKQYLKQLAKESTDLIVLDPPTFSNSKRMEDFLDIQKDHVELINDCVRILSENGILFFSTNYTKFQLEAGNINASEIKNCTKQTIPFDFAGKLKRQCFRLVK